jgi:hypothetical protein
VGVRADRLDPEPEYCDLGTGYYEQRAGTRRQARSHVRSLERLGYKVTLETLGPEYARATPIPLRTRSETRNQLSISGTTG